MLSSFEVSVVVKRLEYSRLALLLVNVNIEVEDG